MAAGVNAIELAVVFGAGVFAGRVSARGLIERLSKHTERVEDRVVERLVRELRTNKGGGGWRA